MNGLFAVALKASVPATSTTASLPAPTPTSGAAAKAAGSPVTSADVTDTFERISGTIPTALAAPFATLRTAAEKLPATAQQNVPDVLAAAPVSAAMKTITHYITDCQPPTTD